VRRRLRQATVIWAKTVVGLSVDIVRERQPAHHAAMVQWSMVIIMTRRLARYRAQRRLPAPQAA
jgi:hypothetical protein